MLTAGGSKAAMGHRLIDAFNRRSAETFVDLADPSIKFHSTLLVGKGNVYHGHDGLGAGLDIRPGPDQTSSSPAKGEDP
jgi:hypothetical protein